MNNPVQAWSVGEPKRTERIFWIPKGTDAISLSVRVDTSVVPDSREGLRDQVNYKISGSALSGTIQGTFGLCELPVDGVECMGKEIVTQHWEDVHSRLEQTDGVIKVEVFGEGDPAGGLGITVYVGGMMVKWMEPPVAGDDDRYVYSEAVPGVLRVHYSVQTVPSDVTHLLEGEVRFGIAAIDGSTLSWDWDQDGLGVYFPMAGVIMNEAVYTGLPPNNESFGPKTVSVMLSGLCSFTEQKQIRVFYPADATNHPEQEQGVTPNWYYYWSTTRANHGAHTYDEAGLFGQAFSYVAYEPPGTSGGVWRAHVSRGANDEFSIFAGPRKGSEPLTGIDTFAYTCRHEARHVEVLTAWGAWQTVSKENDAHMPADADDDLIPNTLEPGMTALEGGPYTPGVKETYDGIPDGHRYVCWTQLDWVPGTADDEDWSSYGKQWDSNED